MSALVPNEARDAALHRLGFRRPNDEARWSNNGFDLDLAGGWAVVRTGASAGSDPLRDDLGRPGLWREVDGEHVFELPPSPALDDPLAGEADPVAAGVDWALRTASGEPVAGWESPPLETLEAAVPGGSFAIRAGALPACGAVHHESDRLALRVPEIARIPEDLPGSRRLWLEEVILDARRLYKLVRLGPVAGSVLAEVDLSGAPHARIESLCRIGVDALRWVVARILPSLSVILDSDRRSELLDRDPARVRPALRRRSHE
jgi:hypothetical protein